MSWQPYLKYKSTGIEWLGEIPEHWNISPVRTFAKSGYKTFTDGDWIESPYIREEGIRLIQTGNIGIGEYREQGFRYIDEETFRQFRCTEICPGDVLICRLADPVGRACLAPNMGNRMITSVDVCILKPRDDVDPGFIVYILSSQGYLSWMSGICRGGTRDRISRSMLGTLRVQKPSFDEQHAIATFLDRETARIDSLIEKKQRQIELLQEKRTALISHAVTKGLNPNVKMKDSGIEWLGEIPEHWKILQLLRVVKRFVDYRGRTPTKTVCGVPLITAGAIKEGIINHILAPEYIAEDEYEAWMRRGLPEVGDIVITTEAPLAEVAQVQETNIAFAQRIILFKINYKYMIPEFLRFYYLSQEGKADILSRASGSTASGIRSDRLKMSLVIVPPIEEQLIIVEYLDKRIVELTSPLSKIRSSIDLLREYRTALISSAVTGKIDVRGDV